MKILKKKLFKRLKNTGSMEWIKGWEVESFHNTIKRDHLLINSYDIPLVIIRNTSDLIIEATGYRFRRLLARNSSRRDGETISSSRIRLYLTNGLKLSMAPGYLESWYQSKVLWKIGQDLPGSFGMPSTSSLLLHFWQHFWKMLILLFWSPWIFLWKIIGLSSCNFQNFW